MWEHKAMIWVNVISFMTIAKVLPSLNHFIEVINAQQH
jgi:hypothetical protein